MSGSAAPGAIAPGAIAPEPAAPEPTAPRVAASGSVESGAAASGAAARRAGWTVVVPVKRLTAAKSRLRGALAGVPHETLALALALDTVTAVLACADVREVLVVTSDPRAGGELRRLGARVVPDPPGSGLNAAFARGASLASQRWVAALTADLPALRPAELGAALRAAAEACRSWLETAPGRAVPSQDPTTGVRRFVADAPGSGTVLLTAAPGVPLDPRFGPGSAAAHAGSGAVALAGDWPSLRRDVDTAADLSAATALGLGRHTCTVLGMQGTVATYDAQTRSGTLLLDDGTELAFPAAAFDASGLRLLRLGQRVRVEHDASGAIRRITLPTLP